jgi:thymidylate synthase (FAD)
MKTSDIEVNLIDFMGSDLSVVNAARVSFHKESEFDANIAFIDDRNPERGFYHQEVLKPSDAKLITYLAKHKHTSPFNHAFLSVRVKAPIFVARQLVKHKFMPWNEVSRRYVDEEPEFYFPENYRKKADNVKQGSSEEAVDKSILWRGSEESYDEQGSAQYALNYYNWLLMNGVCAEQARMVLPQNMMTEWVWSGSLGAFADMLRLRLDPHTQYESRIVANKIKAIVEPLFPVSLPALLEV